MKTLTRIIFGRVKFTDLNKVVIAKNSYRVFAALFLYLNEEKRRMVNILQDNADIREKFREYAVKTMITESVQFIEIVCEFKRHFYTNTNTWRTSKIKLLLRTYIVVSSTLEVNISHRGKEQILKRWQQQRGIDISAFDMFDQAFDEVVDGII